MRSTPVTRPTGCCSAGTSAVPRPAPRATAHRHRGRSTAATVLVEVPPDIEGLAAYRSRTGGRVASDAARPAAADARTRRPDHRLRPPAGRLHRRERTVMRIESVELRRIHLPLVSPFRTSFGVQHDREVLLVRVRTATAEGWGECVAMSEPLYSSEYIDAAEDVLRRFLIPPLLAAERLTAARRRGRCWRRSRAIRWPRPRSRWRCSTPRLREQWSVPGCSSRRRSRPCAERGLGRDHGLGPRPARRRRRLPRRGLPADQAQDRAGLGRRAGPRRCASGSATTCCCRSTPTPRTHWATRRQLARLDPFDLLLIEQPLAEDDIPGHAELARRIRRRSVSTSRSCRPGRPPTRSASAPARSSTSSPAGSAATSRPAGSTTSARPTGSGVVRGDARDRARPGRRTWPWPRCPASRCPATPRRRTATIATDITAPFVLRRRRSRRADRPGDRGRADPRTAGRDDHRQRGRHPLTRWILWCAAWASGRTVNRSMLTCSGRDATQDDRAPSMSVGQQRVRFSGVHRRRRVAESPAKRVRDELLACAPCRGRSRQTRTGWPSSSSRSEPARARSATLAPQ